MTFADAVRLRPPGALRDSSSGLMMRTIGLAGAAVRSGALPTTPFNVAVTTQSPSVDGGVQVYCAPVPTFTPLIAQTVWDGSIQPLWDGSVVIASPYWSWPAAVSMTAAEPGATLTTPGETTRLVSNCMSLKVTSLNGAAPSRTSCVAPSSTVTL